MTLDEITPLTADQAAVLTDLTCALTMAVYCQPGAVATGVGETDGGTFHAIGECRMVHPSLVQAHRVVAVFVTEREQAYLDIFERRFRRRP